MHPYKLNRPLSTRMKYEPKVYEEQLKEPRYVEHPMAISFKIVTEMDKLHNKTHYWNQNDFGKLLANVTVLQGNNILFDDEMINALAQGDETHPRLIALARQCPLQFKYINEALDHIFELAQ